jgi:hypothetical protein
MMKAVLVIYNEAIDLEVGSMLSSIGVEHFTKFTHVYGKGPGSGPRLGDSVWPGGNCALLAIVPPDKAGQVVSAVGKLQEDIPAEGLRVLWWSVEGMV